MQLYIFALVWKKELSFTKFPTLILYLKLQTSIFGRFGILTLAVLSGWVWNLASFWRELWKGLIVSGPKQPTWANTHQLNFENLN